MAKKSRIILFYSPQGGTGKTTIAVNTSILGAINGSKVLLIDLSTFGSIISMLKIPQKAGNGLSSVATFLDLDPEGANSERFIDVIKSSIIKSDISSNLDLLLSCNPIRLEALSETYVKTIINALRNLMYDYIIIDSASELNRKIITLIEYSDRVVIPSIQDVSCGWKLLLFKDVMDKCSLKKEKFGIVINQCSKNSGFNNSEFENEVGYSVIGEIPCFNSNFQNFINQGVLVHNRKNKKAYSYFLSLSGKILNKPLTGNKE